MNEITGLHNHPSIILEKLWKAMFFIVVVFIGSINAVSYTHLFPGFDAWACPLR